MERMRDLLGLTGHLTLARWPWLVAAFLAGFAANHLMLLLAGLSVEIDRFVGLLILPLAVLARLVSTVAMLMVLAGVFAHLKGRWIRYRQRPVEGFLTVLQAAVIPFFTVYTLLGFQRADLAVYQAYGKDVVLAEGLEQIGREVTGEQLDPVPGLFEFRNIVLVAGVILVAWLARRLLQRFGSRLPRAIVFVRIYLEALWVYLTLFVISQWAQVVPQWIQSRRALGWLDAFWTWLGQTVPVFDRLWTALGAPLAARLDELTAVVANPLAWLVLVATVYGTALAPQPLRMRRVRALGWIRRQWDRLNPEVRSRLVEQVSTRTSGWKPLRDAIALMVQAGFLFLGLYILLYSLVDVATTTLFWGIGRGVGAVDPQLWREGADTWSLLITALVEPLRLGLVVAAFLIGAWALGEHRARHPELDPTVTGQDELLEEIQQAADSAPVEPEAAPGAARPPQSSSPVSTTSGEGTA